MTALVNDTSNEPMPEMDQNSVCPGCKLSVLDESGGVVVAFGLVLFAIFSTLRRALLSRPPLLVCTRAPARPAPSA
jgi:hypothetical protein